MFESRFTFAISLTRAVACVLSHLRCDMEIPVRFSVYTAAHLVTFVVCHSPVCFHANAAVSEYVCALACTLRHISLN
jgi:hypothetical protein